MSGPPARCARCGTMVVVIAVLGLTPIGRQPVEEVQAAPNAAIVDRPPAGPQADLRRVPAQPTRRVVAPSSAPSSVVSKVPRPRLKPLERDRSDQVVALLKRTGDAEPTAPSKPQPKPREVAEGGGVNLGDRPADRTAPAERDPIEQLRRELQARDTVIANLLQRVEQLEQRIVLSASQLDRAVGGAGPVSLLHRPSAEAATVPTPTASTPDPVEQDPPAADPVRSAQAQPSEPAPTSPAPGQFEVDEAAADRALERTLVQEGVLLIPLGQAEIEPAFEYTRREVNVPTFVTQNGNTFVGEQRLRRNEFETSATLRVGLPFDSQVEVGVPYNVVDQDVTTTVGGVSQGSNNETGHGLGDVSVGLAKTLLQEDGGWWPDLVGRVTWDADTGKTKDSGVFLGGGFNELSGSLSAVKRQDPLAFVGSVSYAKTFENNDIEPGDELGFSIGTVLAASPETSLSFFFNQTFADDTKIDGDEVNGSDQVAATFSIGAATILGRNVLLSVTGDIGLTDDAPDYAIGASLPIRFDLPVY